MSIDFGTLCVIAIIIITICNATLNGEKTTERRRKKIFGKNNDFNYLEYDKEKEMKIRKLEAILFITTIIGLVLFVAANRGTRWEEPALYLAMILALISGMISINKADCIKECKQCHGEDFVRYRIGKEWYSKCKHCDSIYVELCIVSHIKYKDHDAIKEWEKKLNRINEYNTKRVGIETVKSYKIIAELENMTLIEYIKKMHDEGEMDEERYIDMMNIINTNPEAFKEEPTSWVYKKLW